MQSKGLPESSPALQFESIKSSVLTLLYGPPLTSIYTGKTIALTICAIVSEVTSLFFNTLSRFVIAFLPRSKHILILAAVAICSDFGAQENKLSKLTLKKFYWDIPLFWPPDAKNLLI